MMEVDEDDSRQLAGSKEEGEEVDAYNAFDGLSSIICFSFF